MAAVHRYLWWAPYSVRKNGLSFSIAHCPLFSLCLFPLLDRERSKRVSKEWQLQKKCIL